jgi:hypothetical protein
LVDFYHPSEKYIDLLRRFMMKELLKSHTGRIVMTTLTVLSAATTVSLNAQRVNLSQTGAELGWWSLVLGGLTLMLASGVFLGLVLIRGRRLLESDRWVRVACYGSALVVISTGLSLCGWAIVDAGLLPWAAAQSAILVNVAVPLYMLRCWGGWNRPARPPVADLVCRPCEAKRTAPLGELMPAAVPDEFI